MNHHAELGEFLRSRRARLQPHDVGVQPLRSRRRVPGLRREELAHLAGVSVDYYIRLEQGRCPNVSDSVLSAVSRALQLNDVEQQHLQNLTRPPKKPEQPQSELESARPGLQRLLDSMRDVPAYVINHRTDILAWNTLAAQVFMEFGELPTQERNWARLLYADEAVHSLFDDWEGKVRDTVAFLRMSKGRHARDQKLLQLISDLENTSEHFHQLWCDQSVKDKTYGVKVLHHPLVGELTLNYDALHLPDVPDQILIAYTATRGSSTEASLQLLTTWMRTEAAHHSR